MAAAVKSGRSASSLSSKEAEYQVRFQFQDRPFCSNATKQCVKLLHYVRATSLLLYEIVISFIKHFSLLNRRVRAENLNIFLISSKKGFLFAYKFIVIHRGQYFFLCPSNK